MDLGSLVPRYLGQIRDLGLLVPTKTALRATNYQLRHGMARSVGTRLPTCTVWRLQPSPLPPALACCPPTRPAASLPTPTASPTAAAAALRYDHLRATQHVHRLTHVVHIPLLPFTCVALLHRNICRAPPHASAARPQLPPPPTPFPPAVEALVRRCTKVRAHLVCARAHRAVDDSEACTPRCLG